MDVKFIHALESKLHDDLPGESAHILMAPAGIEKYRNISPDYKLACVLALIFPKEKEWHLCLIERASEQINDKHAGQISFPGGRMDENDDSFEHCALRETYEEIGVSPENIGILGSLSPIFVHVSNFLVHPYVGFTTEYPKFVKQHSEVKNIIEVPLMHFTKSRNKGLTDIQVRDIVIPQTPYYDIYGHKLWGATAMIISELEHILNELD